MSDILRQFAEDARRLHVAQKLPPPGEPIPYPKARAVAEEFDRLLTTEGLSIADVARQMGKGFSPPTISSWKSAALDEQKLARFKGDLDRITRAINEWSESYLLRQTAPQSAGFVDIEVAKRMLAVIKTAMRHRAIGVLCGDSGRGKTLTMEYAAKTYPWAIYVRVKGSTRTPTGLAHLLANQLQLKGVRSFRDRQFKLIEVLGGTSRLVLVDEAHQLQPSALEFLRDLHDDTGVPMVFGGTRQIEDRINDPSVFFGQLGSRVVAHFDVNEYVRAEPGDHEPTRLIHSLDEITRIFATEQVKFTGDGLAALTRLANLEGFGGLRLAKQVTFTAHDYAVAVSRPIDGKLILKVLRELHGKLRAQGRIERALERSNLKVA